MIRLIILLQLLSVAIIATAQEEKKLYENDVMKNVELAKKVEPSEKVCFDKRFTFVFKSGSRSYEGCFLVNTKIGITGTTGFYKPSDRDCSININNKLFHFILFGLKGNEYSYFNSVEKENQRDAGELKHYVMTGNTHKNPLQQLLDEKMLYNKQQTEEFFDGKYKAREYRSADGKEILFLYGKEFPDELKAYSYLGAYSLGYLKCDKGNYFILKAKHGTSEMTVTGIEDLENAMACFDPSVFKVMEETKVVKAIDQTKERKSDLDRQLANQERHRNTPCGSLKYAYLQYQKEQETKKQELMEKMRDEQINYSNPESLKEIAKGYSFIDGLKMERRETEYRLCILKSDLESGKWKAGSENYAKAQEKIDCWETRINEYRKFEEDIDAIDARNSNDAEKAIKEKGEYYKNNVHPRIGELRCTL